jgi:hypothetical protein
MNSVLKVADSYLSVLHTNVYVSGVVTLFLVLYGALAAPALPPIAARMFENQLFKFMILALVLVVRNYNPTMAMLIAVGFVISMQTLSKYRIFTMANELSDVITLPVKIMKGSAKVVSDVISTLSETLSETLSDTGSEQFSALPADANAPVTAPTERETQEVGVAGYTGPDLATIGLPGSTL